VDTWPWRLGSVKVCSSLWRFLLLVANKHCPNCVSKGLAIGLQTSVKRLRGIQGCQIFDFNKKMWMTWQAIAWSMKMGLSPTQWRTICALNVPLHSATCGSRDAMTADQTHMCRSVDRFEADLVYPNRSIHDKHGTPWMLAFPILGTNPTKKKVLLARLLHPQWLQKVTCWRARPRFIHE
jgi:hypothetical protein